MFFRVLLFAFFIVFAHAEKLTSGNKTFIFSVTESKTVPIVEGTQCVFKIEIVSPFLYTNLSVYTDLYYQGVTASGAGYSGTSGQPYLCASNITNWTTELQTADNCSIGMCGGTNFLPDTFQYRLANCTEQGFIDKTTSINYPYFADFSYSSDCACTDQGPLDSYGTCDRTCEDVGLVTSTVAGVETCVSDVDQCPVLSEACLTNCNNYVKNFSCTENDQGNLLDYSCTCMLCADAEERYKNYNNCNTTWVFDCIDDSTKITDIYLEAGYCRETECEYGNQQCSLACKNSGFDTYYYECTPDLCTCRDNNTTEPDTDDNTTDPDADDNTTDPDDDTSCTDFIKSCATLCPNGVASVDCNTWQCACNQLDDNATVEQNQSEVANKLLADILQEIKDKNTTTDVDLNATNDLLQQLLDKNSTIEFNNTNSEGLASKIIEHFEGNWTESVKETTISSIKSVMGYEGNITTYTLASTLCGDPPFEENKIVLYGEEGTASEQSVNLNILMYIYNFFEANPTILEMFKTILLIAVALSGLFGIFRKGE